MKLLHICPSFPFPPNDGGKIVSYHFYRCFSHFGHQVDLLCISKVPVAPEQISAVQKDNRIQVLVDTSIPSLKRLIRCLLMFTPYLMYKFHTKKMMKALKQCLKENHYDALQFEGLQTATYTLKIKKYFRGPIVIRFHNIESQIAYRYAEVTRNWLIKMFLYYESYLTRKLEKKIYRHFSNLLFITPQDQIQAEKVSKRSDRNYFVSPAGVDTEYFTPVHPSSEDLIFLGSMDWKPNQDAILWFHQQVLPQIFSRYPGLKLYIVGKNPPMKIQQLHGDRIIVTGTVPDVRPYLQNCGIAIVPLRIGGGMRVKILELMACGLPVVSTTLGAEGINYENYRDILIADTPDEFIRQISRLLDHPDLRTSIGTQARNKAENYYGWNSIMLALEQYYKKLFSGSMQ